MSAVPVREPGLESIQALIRDDMQKVDSLIQEKLHSEIGLINQLGPLHRQQWREKTAAGTGVAQRQLLCISREPAH